MPRFSSICSTSMYSTRYVLSHSIYFIYFSLLLFYSRNRKYLQHTNIGWVGYFIFTQFVVFCVYHGIVSICCFIINRSESVESMKHREKCKNAGVYAIHVTICDLRSFEWLWPLFRLLFTHFFFICLESNKIYSKKTIYPFKERFASSIEHRTI